MRRRRAAPQLTVLMGLPFVVMAASLVGCAGSNVRKINDSAIAHRISYTDENSQLLAHKTLGLAVDRKTDYRVGPEDVLEISIFEWELRGETRTVEVRVEESGVILLPVLGDLTAGGLTVGQIKSLIETRLVDGGILKKPRVSVVVKEFHSKRVAVVGMVHEPGVYKLRQNVTTLLAILTLAGGVTEQAGQVLYVIRDTEDLVSVSENETALPGHDEVIAVDLYDLLERGRLDLNVVLRNGDVVHVPEAKKFYVIGFVENPGGFLLTHPTSLLEAVALAGGLKEKEASPKYCTLTRRNAMGEEIVSINLVAVSGGHAPNLYLMPNDVLYVRQTAVKKYFLATIGIIRDMFGIGYSLNK